MRATQGRNEAAPAQRAKRRDAGSTRFSERDRRMLALIGEQYAISLEQLARLIDRSLYTAACLRNRWLKAGWVEGRGLATEGPSMIWLTSEGVRAAGSPYRRWRPQPALAAHIHAVTEVRLLLERQLSLGEWWCERELAQRSALPAAGRPHRPDGLLDTGGERIAIEVELSSKSRDRLTEILIELGQSYDQVWYFAPPSLKRTVAALAEAMPWQNIHVHPYPPRAGDLFA